MQSKCKMTKIFKHCIYICHFTKHSGSTPNSQHTDLNTSNGYHGSTE